MRTTEQLDPLTRVALERFKSILSARYGPHLHGLYLFGSRARGDHRPDSDADIAVVLDAADDPIGEQWSLIDLVYDILLDTGVHIQPWVLTKDRLNVPSDRMSRGLVGAIRREGVAL
jgi:predicted nucleotidyltransferase